MPNPNWHKEKQLTEKKLFEMAAITLRPKAKPLAEENGASRQASLKGGEGNCVVSPGTRIDGGFTSSENIRLDGVVSGELRCDRRLVIGEAGRVEGKVTAAEAVIMGSIHGDVIISGSLHLMGTARIEGDIRASLLIVEEGAVYNGKCQIGGKS